MIKQFNYSIIPSDEFFTFTQGMIDIIEPKSELLGYLAPFITSMKNNVDRYQLAFTRFTINPYTQKLKEADSGLDKSFKGLKKYIEAAQFRPDEEWQENTKKLEECIRNHGWTANEFGYKAQIAAMLNMVKDIDEKHMSKIEFIEALVWYTNYRTNLLEFVNLYNESASYVPENELTIKETRQPLIDANRDLLQIIELMGQHNPTDDQVTLEAAINEHITRTMTTVKAAITREAHKEEANQEHETENN